MRVLVACEYSGAVRDAFLALGHDAWSNDIIDTERLPERHLKMDCTQAIQMQDWDLIIIHIPSTAMAVCGNKHYGRGKPRHAERLAAIDWSISVWDHARRASRRVAIENPASVLFPNLRQQRQALIQYVNPWQFGHMEQKRTGLALAGLMPLVPTNNVYKEMMALPRRERERVFFMSPSENRGKERARFYSGIAMAMASQWGGAVHSKVAA